MIDRLLETTDLSVAHFILTMAGFFLAIYVMQLTHWEAEDDVDPPFVRFIRRAALAILAWAMLWSLSYSYTRNWQPWPAELLMIAAIDTILVIRLIAIKARIKREGVKSDAPRAVAHQKF